MSERVFEYKRYMRDGSLKNMTAVPRSRNKRKQAKIIELKEQFEGLSKQQQEMLQRRFA